MKPSPTRKHPRESVYDRLAERYDRLHFRWLRLAGGEAQGALEAMVRLCLQRGSQLLDVGCGTGNLARSLVTEGTPAASITIVDRSSEMLRNCADLPVRIVQAEVEALPFADKSFDIVTCAWALEATRDPIRSLEELCRVVRPGGTLCVAFCSDHKTGVLLDIAMRKAVEIRRTGTFLAKDELTSIIEAKGEYHVRLVPTRGPVSAFFARRFPAPVQMA